MPKVVVEYEFADEHQASRFRLAISRGADFRHLTGTITDIVAGVDYGVPRPPEMCIGARIVEVLDSEE